MGLKSYNDLYKWSIENVAEFWGEVWWSTGVRAEKGFDMVGFDRLFGLLCQVMSWNFGEGIGVWGWMESEVSTRSKHLHL